MCRDGDVWLITPLDIREVHNHLVKSGTRAHTILPSEVLPFCALQGRHPNTIPHSLIFLLSQVHLSAKELFSNGIFVIHKYETRYDKQKWKRLKELTNRLSSIVNKTSVWITICIVNSMISSLTMLYAPLLGGDIPKVAKCGVFMALQYISIYLLCTV